MDDAAKDYRRALGSFATGVTVVTAEDAEGALGLTVNSFTSVSLQPPLILWCLDDVCDRRHVFHSAERFAVNVLSAEDHDRSRRFARGAGRPDADELEDGATGVPLLKGALARFECEVRERIQLGDHQVIVGEVLAWESRKGEGLVFFRGRYGRFDED
ncbi:MAG: flavin reductase family protein [Caulobacteraceae bacterium]|nr:flavin reductase family protein [Caulobacteraceae bacterium]